MKKSKKCDFKKLALLGIAGGAILSTQGAEAQITDYSNLLAFNGCGGHGGCGGTGMGGRGGSYQAYRNMPQGNYYSGGSCSATSTQYYQSSSCHASSCQASTPHYYQSSSCSAHSYPSSSCHSASAPQYYAPTSGCNSTSQGYYQGSQGYYQGSNANASYPTSGCRAASAPQYVTSQPTQGCGGASTSKGASWSQQTPAASQSGAMTQWDTSTADTSTSTINNKASYGEKSSQRLMTGDELTSELNDQGKKAYNDLDAAGKALALKLANQSCKGNNDCKGLNSCKADDHACAGKGSCAGTAKSNFKDKNLAVKVAALKMAEKRANAASPSKY